MKNVVIVFGLISTLVTGELRAATPKAPPADVGAGRIAWFDITTTSLPGSRDFYGKLFDWQFIPVQGTDQAVEIVARGHIDRDAARCGRQDQRIQRSGLCPGDRHPGQLQESERAGGHDPGGVPPGPAGRHRSHRRGRRSVRSPGWPLLEDPARAGARGGEVRIPGRGQVARSAGSLPASPPAASRRDATRTRSCSSAASTPSRIMRIVPPK
jgi:hypothetical protein